MDKLDNIKQKIREAGGSERFTLADVLLAIFEGKVYRKIDAIPLILDSGLFGTSTPSGGTKTTDFSWNLRKDDLNNQSEETIDFLVELLR